MAERKDDIYGWYTCGRCKTPIEYLMNEGKKSQIPCPDCGYYGGEKDFEDVPSEVKIDLTQY